MKKTNEMNLRNVFVILFTVLLLSGCTSSGAEVTQPSQDQSPIKVPETKMVDGVQVATLSWGKLNYEPAAIKLKANVPAKIIADTDRLQGCFRSLQFRNWAFKRALQSRITV